MSRSGGVDKSGVLVGVDKSHEWPGLGCSKTYLLSVVSVGGSRDIAVLIYYPPN